MKTFLLFTCILLTCYAGFLQFKHDVGEMNPEYSLCGPNNPTLTVSQLTFDVTPELGQNSTLTLEGQATNGGFTLGSYSLNLTYSGESILIDGGALNQTVYTTGETYTFIYPLSLDNFIPSGSYQISLEINQPETFPDYEIICLDISFSAY